MKIELNGVTLEEALEITALESKTFWRPVTPNTIFVAAGQSCKAQGTGTERSQDILPRQSFAAHGIAGCSERNSRRSGFQSVQQLPSQEAMVVRGTPDQVALAEKLVEDLDKARPEVIVDIAVMQVSKELAPWE